jgi:hypothetical protein
MGDCIEKWDSANAMSYTELMTVNFCRNDFNIICICFYFCWANAVNLLITTNWGKEYK